MQNSANISVVILTHNSEATISKTLNSVAGIGDEILIIDDFSSDKTLQIVVETGVGAKILQRDLNSDFAAQRNFGIDNAVHENILMVDSDECLDVELKSHIEKLKCDNNIPFNIRFWTNRRNHSLVGYSDERYWRRPIMFKDTEKFTGALHEVLQGKAELKKLDGILHHERASSLDLHFNDLQRYADSKSKTLKGTIWVRFKMLLLFFYTLFLFYFIRGYWRFGINGIAYTILASLTPIVTIIKLSEKK